MPTTSVFSAVRNCEFRNLVLSERLLEPFRDPDQVDGTPGARRGALGVGCAGTAGVKMLEVQWAHRLVRYTRAAARPRW